MVTKKLTANKSWQTTRIKLRLGTNRKLREPYREFLEQGKRQRRVTIIATPGWPLNR